MQPTFLLGHLRAFFFPRHSMIPAQCAEKALMALTTASCQHQNPQKHAPSGQSNRRGRRSEKRAKEFYLLNRYCQGLHSSAQALASANKMHHMHHSHNAKP